MPWSKATVTYERGSYGVLATMSGFVEMADDETTPMERRGFIRFLDDAHPGRTRHIPTRTVVLIDTYKDE